VVYSGWRVPYQSPVVMKVFEESGQVFGKRLKINGTPHSVQQMCEHTLGNLGVLARIILTLYRVIQKEVYTFRNVFYKNY
jgi:hypothetical protein